MVPHTAIRDQQCITVSIPRISQVISSIGYPEIFSTHAFKYAAIGCATFPTRQQVKKCHIHGACRENILRDLTFPVTESGPQRLRDKRRDVRSVYGTDAVLEKGPEVWRVSDLPRNWGVTHRKLDIGTINLLRRKCVQDLMNTP